MRQPQAYDGESTIPGTVGETPGIKAQERAGKAREGKRCVAGFETSFWFRFSAFSLI